MTLAVVLSCEHGGNDVPEPWRETLRAAAPALSSHRGWDEGALDAARDLQAALGAPLVFSTATRLLVDANRSLGHPNLFSEWTRDTPESVRDELVDRLWRPHRAAVESRVRSAILGGADVLHVSLHSFTPVWKGRARNVDVGFLYDPRRTAERAFARAWRDALSELRPELRAKCNQPYRGDADGLTTHLRTLFEPGRYMGLEIELSQGFPRGPADEWRTLRGALLRSLEDTLGAWTET